MNPAFAKYIAVGYIYSLWAALVFAGKAESWPLVAALGTGAASILGYHAITTLQRVPQGEPGPLNVAGPQE